MVGAFRASSRGRLAVHRLSDTTAEWLREARAAAQEIAAGAQADILEGPTDRTMSGTPTALHKVRYKVR